MKNIPDFDQLDDLLKRAGSDVSASESHGMLCGLLCSSGTPNISQLWLTQLIEGEYSEGNSTIKELLEAAEALYQDAVRQINHETLEFSLLMPDIEDSLESRTNNLANWCLGFNYGLGIGGYKESASSTDVVELVRDFNEIARAGYDDMPLEDGEEEEEAFAEIEEYVRLGVLLIMEELQPIKLNSPIVH